MSNIVGKSKFTKKMQFKSTLICWVDTSHLDICPFMSVKKQGVLEITHNLK